MGKNPGATIGRAEHDALVRVLKRARGRKISQEELSLAMGRSPNYINYVEGGGRRVDVVEFMDIADALKLDPSELFDEFLREVGRKK